MQRHMMYQRGLKYRLQVNRPLNLSKDARQKVVDSHGALQERAWKRKLEEPCWRWGNVRLNRLVINNAWQQGCVWSIAI